MLLVLCLATAAGLEASCANGSCRTKRLQRSVSVDQIKGGKPPAPCRRTSSGAARRSRA
jgi:hypothetical protein